MIYGLKRKIKGVERLVFISAYDSEDSTYNTFKSVLASETIGARLYNLGAKIQIMSDDVSSVAGEETLVFPVITSLENAMSVEPIYRVFERDPNFSEIDKVVQMLNSRGGNFTKEGVESIFQGFREYTAFCNREETYIINVDRTFIESIETLTTINVYNSKRTVSLPFLTSEMNKTIKMETEFDKLFIKLPRYESLQDTENVMELMPTNEELGVPYPHPIYYTPHIVWSYDMAPKEREEFLKRCMVGSGNPGMEGLPQMKVNDLVLIPKKHIIGNPANNTLPIREEELDFQEALRQYIKFDIEQSFPDKDVEETYKEGICSSKMFNYLQGLVTMILRRNWTHNNKIEVGGGLIDDEDLDDDSLDVVTEEEQWDTARFLIFPFGKDNPALERADGIPIMTHYLKMIMSKVGFDGLIEAIIKLSRWGELKPSILVVEGSSRYLDLNTFTIRNTTGDISCLKEVPFNGHKYEFVRFVVQTGQLPDRTYLSEKKFEGLYTAPVGVELKLHLEESHYQTVYMSLLDLVNLYQESPSGVVYGIKYEDGRFTTTLEGGALSDTIPLSTVIKNLHRDEEGLFKIETSSISKSMELKSSGKGFSIMESIYFGYTMNNVLSQLGETTDASSIEEIIDLSNRTSVEVGTIIKTNILKTVIPVLENVERKTETYDDLTADVLLNSYVSAKSELSYINEFQFLSEVSGKEETVIMKDESTMLKSFTQGGSNEIVDPKQFTKDLIIAEPEFGEKIYALKTKGLNPNSEPKTLCGVVVRDIGKPKKLQILVGASRVLPESPAMNTEGMLVLVAALGGISNIITNGESFTRFASQEDLNEIISTYMGIIKG